MNLDDKFSNIHNPTQYLIHKKWEHQEKININTTSLLNRLLILLDKIDKKVSSLYKNLMNKLVILERRINDLMIIIMRLEKKHTIRKC
jgi:hypothetical protein